MNPQATTLYTSALFTSEVPLFVHIPHCLGNLFPRYEDRYLGGHTDICVCTLSSCGHVDWHGCHLQLQTTGEGDKDIIEEKVVGEKNHTWTLKQITVIHVHVSEPVNGIIVM